MRGTNAPADGTAQRGLTIPRGVIDAMIAHARSEMPLEACGLLAGGGGTVREAVPMRNADASGEHFSLDPEEQLAAVKRARARGLEIIAAYHSHPTGPCRPSAEDIRLALDPGLIHVILSMEGPEPVAGAFIIRDGEVSEVPLITGE